jgi:hypothetical protein
VALLRKFQKEASVDAVDDYLTRKAVKPIALT